MDRTPSLGRGMKLGGRSEGESVGEGVACG